MNCRRSGGIGGIEGQVSSAGLVGGEECDEHVERAREGDADQGFGSGAVGDEPMGELIGAGVEFGVGEAQRVRVLGWPVASGVCGTKMAAVASGVRAAHSFEEGVDGEVGQVVGGVVPGGELGLFGGGEHGQIADGGVGLGDCGGEQFLEVADHPANGRRIEEIYIVLKQSPESIR